MQQWLKHEWSKFSTVLGIEQEDIVGLYTGSREEQECMVKYMKSFQMYKNKLCKSSSAC